MSTNFPVARSLEEFPPYIAARDDYEACRHEEDLAAAREARRAMRDAKREFERLRAGNFQEGKN
jgi:hypothetical protein